MCGCRFIGDGHACSFLLKPSQQLIKRSLPLGQSLPFYTVVHVVPIALRHHETGISQDLEMLGDGALSHPEPPCERPDAQNPLPEKREDVEPCLDRQDSQHLSCLCNAVVVADLVIHIRLL